MDRNAAAHNSHDELLLARLFGGDLQGRELERARERVSSCTECAAVLADFEAIAAATAGLPAPSRPRDFRIGEEKAKELRGGRLMRPAGLRTVLRRLGPARSLGASMAVVGVAGMLVVGAVSLFGPQGVSSVRYDTANGPQELSAGGQGMTAAPASGDGKGAYAWATVTPAAVAAGTPVPALGTESSARTGALNAASPAASTVITDEGGQAATTSPAAEPPSAPATSTGTSDSGPLWVIGFGVLVAAGLALLAVPGLRKRNRAGPGR